MNIFNRARGSFVLLLVALCACASAHGSTRADLRTIDAELSPLSFEDDRSSEAAPSFDGSLASYLAYAYAHSPALRADFEAWRAATHRPAQAQRLPEPTVTYTAFVRSVETRVGPQRHRLGASQWFPWPTKLTAGRDAANLEAQAAQRRFDARALELGAEVAIAYWEVWRLHKQQEVLAEEVEVLAGLSEQVRVRVEVSAADLADLSQVDLTLSRTRDGVAGLDQKIAIAQARLVRALGAPIETPTPVRASAPAVEPVAEAPHALYADAGSHPDVQRYALLSDSAGQRVRRARADRAPSFGIGVDWILTGDSSMTPAPMDDGKDAVSVSLSMKVPLWARAYRASEDEARAEGASMRARAIDARNVAVADVRAQLARIEDDVRRVKVFETTLIPQAEATFESVLISYAAGRSSVGDLLGSERALLELRSEKFVAQADYAVDLARLERGVGRPVRVGVDRGEEAAG